MVYALSYFLAKPEHQLELIACFLSLREHTQREEGCIEYELYQDLDNPNFLIVSEKFRDLKALEDHEKEPYVVNFIKGPMHKFSEKVIWNVCRRIQPE